MFPVIIQSRPRDAIVGGEEAVPHSIPWQVSHKDDEENGDDDDNDDAGDIDDDENDRTYADHAGELEEKER